MSRWSEDQANTWWAKQPWVCGFNYLPSTAVNFLEMWHPDTFHRKIIARELEWASQIGFNAVRFNLQYLVWKNDREGLIDRLSWLIQTAGNFGISSVPCLFDDCGFGWFMYDFASAISFIEDSPMVSYFKSSWIKGYKSVRELSVEDEKEIDTFIMLRRMALLAWIGSHIEAPEPQQLSAGFAETTAKLGDIWLNSLD